MAIDGDNDLLPEQTEGYKVGEKKTMDEYEKMGEPSPSILTC
jgi:Rho GDP-dissociation inhibitor